MKRISTYDESRDASLKELEKGDEIVMTGISGKFPNSHHVYHLRDNLFNKFDMVTDDNRRWEPINPEIPQRTGKLYDIDKFDLGFFGVTKTQGNHMDPMLRMLLEKAHEAIMDAGYSPADFVGTNTAVIVGYSIASVENPSIYKTETAFNDTITGCQASMVAARISYYLKLRGPSHMIDSGCSSSLFAIEEARTQILEGRCDRAIVAGTNLCLHPALSHEFARIGAISPDGSSKSFDNAANGYARSEAVAVILLEKAKCAKRNYGEIVHVKHNCDGFKVEGLTFPSAAGQKLLMKELYQEAQVDPATVAYVEGHGTGTNVGDLQELNALDEIFGKRRNTPLLIGAVKSNMGHAEPASGLCSVIKVIIAMESGFIPPNLHYKQPRKGVEGLEKGRMHVVTENTPVPEDQGLFGINNFGLGGTNAHLLLRRNTKAKVNQGIPADNIPRLICVHGRTEEAVTSILNDVGSRPLDVEHVYLIHQAFRKETGNNLHRGFGIFTKQGEAVRSLKRINIEKPKLFLVFSNFDKEWLKVGQQLMELPIFSSTIKRVQAILTEASGVELFKTIMDPTEASIRNEILGNTAIQLCLAEVLKSINLNPDRIIGIGSAKLVADYANNYLTFKETVLGSYALTSYLINMDIAVDNNNNNWEAIEKIFSKKKKTKFMKSFAKYVLNIFAKSTDETHIKQMAAKDAISLIIGSDIEGLSCPILHLIDVNSKNSMLDLLNNLGSLYEYGFDMELNKLYPDIELPVSRGTPMLSPLIKWRQDNCKVFQFKNEFQHVKESRLIKIAPMSEEWKFIFGHVVDGRKLFPATGYLLLAWKSFATIMSKRFSEMQIVFEDVKYIRPVNIPKNGMLEFEVTIQIATHAFEIAEGGIAVTTGKIYEKTEEQVFVDIPIKELEKGDVCMDEKDIYKELRLRGYYYTGIFRGIKACTLDATLGILHWDYNWITFLDCVLQMCIVYKDTRNLYVPASIGQLIIDAPKHIESCKENNNIVPARWYKNLNVVRTEGIEVRGLGKTVIGKRKGAEPVLEMSKFIPNKDSRDVSETIRIFVQIVAENTNASKIKAVEACPRVFENSRLLSPMIQKALDDLPSVKQDLTVLTNKHIEMIGISVQNKSFRVESNCSILVLEKVLETTDPKAAINSVKGADGFIISREDLDTDLSKFDESPFNVICNHTNEQEMLVLLRPTRKYLENTIYFHITNELEDFQWMTKLQELIRSKDKIVIYSQNTDITGLLGFSRSLQREEHSSKIKSFLIMDEAPKFDPKLEFYRKQLDKDMAINVWKDGAWGTYRHLSLLEKRTVETEDIYGNARVNISSLAWTKGPMAPEEQTEIIQVYYSILNFRDFMFASGKILPDLITPERMQQGQGFQFAGRNSRGQRVMGTLENGPLALSVQCDKLMIYEIPDGWSMEEAAITVSVYSAVLRVFDGLQLKPTKSILINSATGGFGLAAINICLSYKLNIFVTVSTQEKRKLLRKYYPDIKEEHIGNTGDESFETMVLRYTNGQGVDFVLNSLGEEKLLASVRCLARGGQLLQIGKINLATNNALSLHLLEKDASFALFPLEKHSIGLDCKARIHNWFSKLLRKGTIKPLPRTIFKRDDVEKFLRYKQMDNVLIKIRKEEDDIICSVPKTPLKSLPKFFCNPSCSYLICGGLGGFGLELADLFVARGAKNLILTSTSGITNGYQKYRISIWKRYGVKVLTSTLDASSEESCAELLRAAGEMGPLDGIFNLALVLRDALFENQTEESFKTVLIPKAYSAKNLDKISRKLYPNLRYFVVFSSYFCGRGNMGQTNYGMANSVMERICEKRKREGYPALAIQWGAIADVGYLIKTHENSDDLVVGGTLQQKMSSCLQVMDKFLEQNEPVVCSMVVAEKKYGETANNLFDTVLNIMGISNLRSVSMHSTLPELGMDSMTAVEIKQTLEREYDVFLTAQDIRGTTLLKLQQLSSTTETKVTQPNPMELVEFPEDIYLLFHNMGTNKSSYEPVIRMKTLMEQNEAAPHIFLLPGFEGTSATLEPLCEKLKAHVSCLQFRPGVETKSITQLASSLIIHFEEYTDDLIIVAHSFGCVVAMELLYMLEAKGRDARVVLLDGSPEILAAMLELYFPNFDENLFQMAILSSLTIRYMTRSTFATHQKQLLNLCTYKEKINYMTNILSFNVDVSTEDITNLCIATYERLIALYKYEPKKDKLKSRATLFKASSTLFVNASPAYSQSSSFENLEKVVTLDGNHVTILANEELSMEINKILEEF